MHTISKDFSLCYGHRVYTQTLDPVLSNNDSCKCRHLHGHEGLVRVHLSANNLKNGMVTDFKHLNWLKKFFDDFLDHKMLIGLDDPYEILPEYLQPRRFAPIVLDNLRYITDLLVPQPHPDANPEPHELEVGEGLVFVPFVPTSENLSKWTLDFVSKVLERSEETKEVWCSKVEWWETPKSCAVAIRDEEVKASPCSQSTQCCSVGEN